jgi:hypothetical protein
LIPNRQDLKVPLPKGCLTIFPQLAKNNLALKNRADNPFLSTVLPVYMSMEGENYRWMQKKRGEKGPIKEINFFPLAFQLFLVSNHGASHNAFTCSLSQLPAQSSGQQKIKLMLLPSCADLEPL